MTARRWGTAPLLTLALAGCISGSYDHASVDDPVATAQLEQLQPGHDDLAACLRTLGAPQRVYEYRRESDGTSGAALLWFWRDSSGWGVKVSSPSDKVPGSVTYDHDGTDLPGCMLWFGPDLVLERWRQGFVGDLQPRLRPDPPRDP